MHKCVKEMQIFWRCKTDYEAGTKEVLSNEEPNNTTALEIYFATDKHDVLVATLVTGRDRT